MKSLYFKLYHKIFLTLHLNDIQQNVFTRCCNRLDFSQWWCHPRLHIKDLPATATSIASISIPNCHTHDHTVSTLSPVEKFPIHHCFIWCLHRSHLTGLLQQSAEETKPKLLSAKPWENLECGVHVYHTMKLLKCMPPHLISHEDSQLEMVLHPISPSSFNTFGFSIKPSSGSRVDFILFPSERILILLRLPVGLCVCVFLA